MTETAKTTDTETKSEEGKPEEAKPEEKKRRTRVVRETKTFVWQRVGSGPNWKVAAGPFNSYDEAETWIDKEGRPNQYYWPLRGPMEAIFIKPREIVYVTQSVQEVQADAAPKDVQQEATPDKTQADE